MILCSFYSIAQDYTLKLTGNIQGQTSPRFHLGEAKIIIDGVDYRTYGPATIPITINTTNTIGDFNSFQLNATGIIGNFPLICEQRDIISNSSRDGMITSHSISTQACGVTNISASLIPNINSIFRLNGSGNLCIGSQLSLGATSGFPNVAYNWQYSTNGTDWIDFPSGFNHGRQVNATIEQIIGPTHENFLETDILFRVGGYNKGQFSGNTLTVRYSSCAPLITSLNYNPPKCTGDPVSVEVNFNRPLNTGETFSTISIIDVSNSSLILVQNTNQSTDVSGGTKYTFNNVNVLQEGDTYRVQYQMQVNGVLVAGFISSTETFTYNDKIPVTFNTDHTNPSCTVGQGPTNDGSIIINNVSNGTPPYFYEINGDNNWISFTGTSVSIPKSAGSYDIKVRDTNQCLGTSGGNSVVTEIIDPAASAIVITKIDEAPTTYNGASNGYANATITGGTPLSNGSYTFSWENSSGANVAGGSGVAQSGPDRYEINLPNLSADTYTLTVTDDKGCSTISDFVINEPPILEFITTEKNDVSCGDNDQTNNDGIIKANVQGGLPDYQYQVLFRNNTGTFEPFGSSVILGTAQEFVASGLSGGIYRVQVKDNLQDPGNTNPLLISGDIEIIQPTPFLIQNIVTTEALCIGQASGSITLDIIGGTGTYMISMAKDGDPGFNKVINNIPNNSTAFVINDLSQGVYTLTVQDQNGCDIINPILEKIISITDPSLQWNIDLGENTMLCKGQSHTVDATIGDPLATYRWESDNGFSANTPNVSLSESGVYTVVVTTGLGCLISSSIQITATQTSIAPEFVVPSDIFVDESFVIVDVSNPSPITVEWIIPDNAEIIESTREYAEIKFTETGSFDITLQTTNAIGCQESYTKNITIRERVFKEETEGKEKLKTYKIFPNPTRGNFAAELTFKEPISIDIKLFNVANNSVLYRHQDDGASEYNIPFNLEGSLSSGIYFLLLEIPGKTYVRKIVVE
ncbi:hypothetical protein ATO12_10770 [Aquimarina atlantica]|uniref:PKD domain-containing protein n=2 Tax=Aquimarina atlantica TaxID=1317122 RepID=A0A023BMV3_9FLAO|nr:hypothetical protein ATO12_10770 [Aquimarina atlantica]